MLDVELLNFRVFAQTDQMGLDGMITDDLELVQSSIKELQNKPDYALLLMSKAADLLNFV